MYLCNKMSSMNFNKVVFTLIISVFILKSGVSRSIAKDSIIKSVIAIKKESIDLFFTNPDSALLLIDESILLSTAHSLDSLFAYCTLTKSQLLNRKSEYEVALGLVDEAFDIFTKRNDSVGLSLSLIQRGDIQKSFGDFISAQQSFDEAHQTAISINDSVQLIHTLNRLGMFYSEIKNQEYSREFYLEMLKVAKARKDTTIILVAQTNLGNSYSRAGQYEQAFEYHARVYDYSFKNTNNRFYYLSLINLSNVSYLTEKYLRAIEYGDRALIAIEDYNKDPLRNASVYHTLAMSYLALGEIQKSKNYIAKLCVISNGNNSISAKFDCLESSIAYHKKTRNYKDALFFAEEFYSLKDSLYNPEVVSEVANFKVNVDLEDKDQEISNLQEVSDLISKRARRAVLLMGFVTIVAFSLFSVFRYRQREKEAILQRKITESKLSVMQSQMNPHFIFNAFTAVQNFILKSEKLEAYKYLNKLASLLRQIVSITDNTYINLDTEITFLKDYLELEKLRFREKIDYNLHIEDELSNTNPLIPSMMIQPHIENAIIHGISGLERKGEISITFESDHTGLKCIVRDNGRGRKEAEEVKKNGYQKHLNIASTNSNKRLAFLKEIGYDHAKVTINDLYQETTSIGTEVIIYLPFINHTE